MPGGRPSKYSTKLAKEICLQLAQGKPMIKICADPKMPTYVTTLDWRTEGSPRFKKEFSDMYDRARRDQADFYAEQCLQIADQSEGDVMETDDGRNLTNYENINRSKLRVDTRKWFASKMFPRNWGEKQETVVKQTVRRIDLTGNPDDDDNADI